MAKIVVGIDGSETSKSALRWAIAHAAPGDAVVALHAWSVPMPVAVPFDAVTISEGALESAAHQLLDRVVDEVVHDGDFPVEKRVAHRGAGEALVRASGDADLLVVGSRGYGAVRGLLLGSTGQYCASHARCPVVVIPHHAQAA
jgi:nucleotide-binding universal stress UspA family protein